MLSDDDQKLAKILFGLLKNATSQAVVKEFLRTKGIPVSAQNWDDLYEKRIEPALKDKKLALKDLRDLLQQVEEFGKQHSFLFQCTEERAIGLLSPARIASIAAAEGLSGLFTHPLDLEMPDEATIVDIRLYRPDPQKTPVSLTIKVVESRDINRLSAVETDPATGELIRRYATTKKRAVNIVHLDHTGLLEFRIASQDNQAKKYSELLWVLKNKVRKFLPDDGFAEVSLSPAKNKILRERDNLSQEIRYSNSTARNEFGAQMQITSASVDENLSSDEGSMSALDRFLERDGEVTGANIYVKLPDSDPPRELRLLISGERNEFAVTVACSAGEYEYVRGKVIAFNT
ncbi:hypothetical protein CSV86_005310 [Pseudomonas putida CSV86]|uniref:Uncharacterized protein n=1 Tax=Pseudomonas bharatica CSV86 TaxID=1005395 RepID=L1M5W9_9PSED|nr:hypothetical protein [Pseudomonas bharatica]NNJ14703.1 hypothetical protein [Pseudomonas bharatica CSV86]